MVLDIFVDILRQARPFFRDAALAAAHQLRLERLEAPFDVADVAGELGVALHALTALLDVLVLEGYAVHDGSRVRVGPLPPCPALPQNGWGALGAIIASRRPVPHSEVELAPYHAHLAEAGRPAAIELTELLCRALPHSATFLDVGCGAGTYSWPLLRARPLGHATLVDAPRVLELARAHGRDVGERFELVGTDTDGVPDLAALLDGRTFDLVLLANVLHLYGPAQARALVAAAVGRVGPGGRLVVKDLAPDGPDPALPAYFTLNMVVYTAEGRVYGADDVACWMRDAGLPRVTRERQASAPESWVLVGARA